MIVEKKQYEITVILASYNPDPKKLFKTIDSVIGQRNVLLQLIVCDDGSRDNMFGVVREYLDDKGFSDYKLIPSEKNNGTIINFNNGLSASEGKYIKGISPGDYLYDPDELRKWIDFMERGGYGLSFGHPVCYRYEDGVPKIVKRGRDIPAIANIYDADRKSVLQREIRKIDWLVCRDSILGCLVLCRRDLCLQYIKEIVNKLKFAEDHMYRLMLLDNIQMIHYDAPVVYYEYGDGVSTSPKKRKKYLYNDEMAFLEILKSGSRKDRFIRKYCSLIKYGSMDFYGKRRQFFAVLFFPISLPWKIYKLIYRKLGKSRPYEDTAETLETKIGL